MRGRSFVGFVIVGALLGLACRDGAGVTGTESSETGDMCPIGAEGCPCGSGEVCDDDLVCQAGSCICPVGAEGCPCTLGGFCDAELVCMSNQCLDPGGGDDGTGTTGGTSTTGTGTTGDTSSTGTDTTDGSGIADGLILHLPLDGDGVDVSGLGNHGVVLGAIEAPDRFGNPGSAMYFDGVDDLVRVPFSQDFDVSEEMSMSWGLWARTTELPVLELGTYMGLDADCANYAFALQVRNDGTWFSDVHAGGCWDFVHAQGLMPLDEWHHLFVTLQQNTLTLYLDGEQHAQSIVSPVNWVSGVLDLCVGAWCTILSPDPDIHITGYLDEVRVYDRALSSAEVVEVYETM